MKETQRLIALSVEKILIILILKYLEQKIIGHLCNQHVAIARIKSHDLKKNNMQKAYLVT